MIIHGNKQISGIIYARKASDGGGAVALTNIIRGPQVVFGGLKPGPFPRNWLSAATIAAILAAFGQTDGKAVIKATNMYLNAIAATDPTKAQALAGYINEDPMMVCSLGLSVEGVTMPIRWLVGDGTAYIDLPFQTTKDDNFELIGYKVSNSNWFFGTRPMGLSQGTILFTNSDTTIRLANCSPNGTATSVASYSGIIYLKTNGRNFEFNGRNYTMPNAIANSIPYHMCLFGLFDSGRIEYTTTLSNCKIAKFVVTNDNNIYIVPFIRQGANGMIDTLTGTFYPNANSSGAFAIEYTLPDGTPWTPLTPTP